MEIQNSNYSGVLSVHDFNTSLPSKQRIQRQHEAEEFQKQLAKATEWRDKEKIYRKMSIEQLKFLKLISNTDGRPSSDMTDKRWQEEFKIRKLFITPYPDTKKTYGGKYSKEYRHNPEKEYHGATNYQEYATFINDILRNIRGGQTDYCYFIYQIMDLAKFHYHDLKTLYNSQGYWSVWLDK